jgi:hypothetical protein
MQSRNANFGSDDCAPGCTLMFRWLFLVAVGFVSVWLSPPNALASCGGWHGASPVNASDDNLSGMTSWGMKSRPLKLTIWFRYVAGQFVVSHRAPVAPCIGNSCLAKTNLRSDAIIPISVRIIGGNADSARRWCESPAAMSSRSVCISNIGAPRDGHRNSIEHPPRAA